MNKRFNLSHMVPVIKLEDKQEIPTLSVHELNIRKSRAVSNGEYYLASFISRITVIKSRRVS